LPLFKREAPEQRFWRWFEEHEGELFAFESDQERVFEALARELHRVHRDLTFEFGPVEDGVREFVISAGGIRTAFPVVERLAAAAPELARWRVIRFRPRRDPSMVLEFGGANVRGEDVLVHVRPEGRKVGLTLFMEGYRATPQSVYEQIGYLLLDNALGEYAVETRVGSIEFGDPAQSPGEGMIPLVDLPAEIDRLDGEKPA